MTFLDYYDNTISPKLKEIDITIKGDSKLTITKVCELLNISINEYEDIISKNSIKTLDKMSFFFIMINGSSEICQLFRKEMKIHKFSHYSIDDICYIYNLTYPEVFKAKEKCNITDITNKNIRTLFSNINF